MLADFQSADDFVLESDFGFAEWRVRLWSSSDGDGSVLLREDCRPRRFGRRWRCCHRSWLNGIRDHSSVMTRESWLHDLLARSCVVLRSLSSHRSYEVVEYVGGGSVGLSDCELRPSNVDVALRTQVRTVRWSRCGLLADLDELAVGQSEDFLSRSVVEIDLEAADIVVDGRRSLGCGGRCCLYLS